MTDTTGTPTLYRFGAMHALTVAAIYTPPGEPIAGDVYRTHDEKCTACPGTFSTRRYARRAARKYLEAYARQNGEARPVACGMTYAANMLTKVLPSLDLELPGERSEWWGTRFLALAEQIVP